LACTPSDFPAVTRTEMIPFPKMHLVRECSDGLSREQKQGKAQRRLGEVRMDMILAHGFV
jgi:hypothetical protein